MEVKKIKIYKSTKIYAKIMLHLYTIERFKNYILFDESYKFDNRNNKKTFSRLLSVI